MIRAIKLVLVNFAVVLMLLFLIEGFSSFLLVGRKVVAVKPIAERVHTEYDEQLGWVNLPNIFIKDMYGPGVYFTTNSQRYRSARNFSVEIPNDKIRIVCSGDSFTLGYGVDDDHTWCQLLTSLDRRLETVNLGQGGYGVDQAYLWYKRNEKNLNHNIHIFAFITYDFLRMERDTFVGYGKPYLETRGTALFQVNRPVPRRSYYAPRLTTALRTLQELRTVELLRKAATKLGLRDDTAPTRERDVRAKGVVSRIFADLQHTNEVKKSLLVLVYLPTFEDYMGLDPETKYWRKYVQAEADKNHYFFVDVVKELRSLPPESVKELFKGHFSNEGNRYVADVLHQKLIEISAISAQAPAMR